MTIQQLPARPNLEQLKRQAKELLHSAGQNDPSALARFRALPAMAAKTAAELAGLRFALHDAQSVLAREHGFVSWHALRERVEELTLEFSAALGDFLCCAVDGRSGRAERLLELHPGIAAANFHTALVLGDAAAAHRHLERNPSLAIQRGGPRNWEPLLYVCQTCLHRETPARAEGLVAIARRLLALGADPNASFSSREHPAVPLSALWGATCQARIRALAELLLAAGAKPDDGESVYHAAEHGDVPMLELLHQHGASVDGGTNRWGNTPLYFILGHPAESNAAEPVRTGARWLLVHGADPNRPCGQNAETAVHLAAQNWDPAMLALLEQHGADLRRPRADGRTPFALAALHGHQAAAEWLRERGAAAALSNAECFVAACTRGDRAAAEAMLRDQPQLRTSVRDDPELALRLHKIAERGDLAALETMLACGFDVRATDCMGATPLHWAAFSGHLAAVRLLLAHGAPVEARDKNFNALPLGWADHGSIHQPHPRGDYAGVVLALLRAGSPLHPDEAAYGDAVQEALAEFRRGA